MIDDLASLGVAVPANEPTAVAVDLVAYAGGIEVTGTVAAPWATECRRCGIPVTGRVEVAVRERYVPDPSGPGGPGGPAATWAGEDDAYRLDGDDLDLEPLARDAVLLNLPLAPLCRPDCLGLCATCGADLNLAPCGCSPPADPRWAALDVLRDDHPPSGA